MKRTLWNLEFLLAFGLIGFAILFFCLSFTFGRTAALLPRLVSFVMICLGLLHAGKVVFAVWESRKKYENSAASMQVKAKGGVHGADRMGVSFMLLLMVGYVLLVYLVGFGFPTFCYAVALPYLTGYRVHKVIFPFAVAMVVLIIFVFGHLFMVPLPQGLLFLYFLG